jgi:putative transposase
VASRKEISKVVGASHVFSEIYLHVTWHCLGNRSLLTREIEQFVHEILEQHCRKTRGVHFKGVGGTENHIHLVFQAEPFVVISEFIGKIKGASSHEANKQFGRATLQWQRGYGVVSFSKRYLKSVQDYVNNQKEHHKKGSLNKVLQRVEPTVEKPR